MRHAFSSSSSGARGVSPKRDRAPARYIYARERERAEGAALTTAGICERSIAPRAASVQRMCVCVFYSGAICAHFLPLICIGERERSWEIEDIGIEDNGERRGL